jgi:hypothetical protein
VVKAVIGYNTSVLRMENNMIPNDPMMLLSFINMKLRDEYDSFDSLCDNLDVDKDEIVSKLGAVGYRYNKDNNQFK